uniref:Exostosin GT47 domain-containing protein n=1 Tax=viral metagenome TaxID=1070528 RepID=A0A6C0IVK8_9ZZZZ
MNIFIYKKCNKELDFFKNDIFSPKQFNKTNFYEIDSLKDIKKKNLNTTLNSIIVINDKFGYINTLIFIYTYRPKIIFYLSDEKGIKSIFDKLKNFWLFALYGLFNILLIYLKLYTLTVITLLTTPVLIFAYDIFRYRWYYLAHFCGIFFHQYNHKIDYNKNCIQIPLGYISNYLNNSNKVKNINKRNINFAFVGALKSDRGKMLDILGKEPKINFVTIETDCNNQKVNQGQLWEIYNSSIFAPIGRGNYKLDCFRIYEAILAGSIPLIVGTESEINHTFNYNNYMPIFITSDSWENMYIKCKTLLNNKNKLQTIQNYNINWWKNYINLIQYKISNIDLKENNN